MKKLLTKILIGILAVATMLGAFAGCSSSKTWDGTTMTGWDKDASIVGGFIGEKGNYLYYINGVADSTSDNTFGVPVKGALMAVDKNDFSKNEVVVPKLFVAKDYNAGLYIYGDYVYYGTPNTDKNSSGGIANDELTFMKTKLDGTETTKLFTISSLYDEYRIIQNGDSVVIVYKGIDGEDNQTLEAYDCATGAVSIIAKTDAEVSGANGESLNAYFFAGNGEEFVVYYTVTVYAEDYNEDKSEERATADYNKVYGYSVKDGAKVILDGATTSTKLTPSTYEIKLIKNGKLYYSETENGATKVYELGNDKAIKNEEAVASTTLFADSGIYTVTEGKISKVDLYNNNLTQTVAVNTGATALHAVKGNDIYFTDAEGGISRIELGNADANIVKITESSANTAWYPIQFIGDKMFYSDNSSLGASYIKYVEITGAVKEEDTDDDGENDKFYLEGQSFLGKITDDDVVSIASAKVTAISSELEDGVLPFETDSNGNLYVKVVNEAELAIKDLDVSEETSELLAKYKKAIEMANLYNQLEGIRDNGTTIELENKYNSVKAQIQSFRAGDDYSEVSALIGNNLLANYDRAVSLFDAE